MPGSKQHKLSLLLTLHFCGVATAYGDHDDYLQKLDAFANSPDPQLESGIASNDVFSIDVNGTFEEMIQGSTLFKYYAILDFITYPDGIFGDSFDRLLITTQEVHIDDSLEHIINDDLYNFTNDDMNLTGELFIDEFRTTHGFDVLYWEAKQISLTSNLRNIYKFHLRGPKVLQGTSLHSPPYSTWLHVSFLFESENGELDIETMKQIVDSIQFSESTNIPFEPDEKTFTAVDLITSPKKPQWYNSKWLGNYYDSTKGWIYHEYLEWVYSKSGVANDGLWLWHQNIGWMWTQSGTYPYLYSYLKEDWIFLDLNSVISKRFYDFSLEQWTPLSEENFYVELNQMSQQKGATSTPRGQEQNAVNLIANSKIPIDEARKRISEIILFGL